MGTSADYGYMCLLVSAVPWPVCIKSKSVQEDEFQNFVFSFVSMSPSEKNENNALFPFSFEYGRYM